MRHRQLARLGLLLSGTVAGLLLGEVIVALFWPQIFERHPPGMYASDPEIGYVLTPRFRGTLERSEFSISFTTGREGLRGGNLSPRREETVRVLILGDSQVWGYGVGDDETLSSRLQELLAGRYPGSDVQVLNGGVPGYGTADELAWLRSRGKALDPDVVLLVFLPVNDFDENRTPAITRTAIEDGYLVWRSVTSESARQPLFLRVKSWLKFRSHLVRLASDAMGYLVLRGGLVRWAGSLWETGESFSSEDASRTRHLLEEVVRTAEELGARSMLVYTTGQDRILSPSYEPLPSRKVVEEAAAAAGVPWVDVTPPLRDRAERLELFFRHNGHWTAAGHRAVAEVVADELVSRGLIDSQPEH